MNALAENLQTLHSDADDVICLTQFERRYQALMTSPGSRDAVSLALRNTSLATGKRTRPQLMMHAAYDLGIAQSRVIDLAVAVEMVHTASLILDDLPCMDDSALRRGRPTMHREFGEHVAILAAVGLLMKAFEIVSNHPTMTASQRIEVVNRLSRASGMDGLVQGQLRDLQEGFSNQSSADAQMTNLLKTGVLFDAALQSVGVLANAHPSDLDALSCCARELGHAFQLADDFKDDPAHAGAATDKDVGKDIGRPTLLALLGKRAARDRITSCLAVADASLAASPAGFCSTRRYMRDMAQYFSV